MKTGMPPSYFDPYGLLFWVEDKKIAGTMPWLRYTATIDDVWKEREKHQDSLIDKRAKSWNTRFWAIRG